MEPQHSNIKLGEAVTVKRGDHYYMIPTPNNAAYVQTENGRYLKQETVDKIVNDFFGKKN